MEDEIISALRLCLYWLNDGKAETAHSVVGDLLYTLPPSSRTRRLHHHITRPCSIHPTASLARAIKYVLSLQRLQIAPNLASVQIVMDLRRDYWFDATSRAVNPVIPSDKDSHLVGSGQVPLLNCPSGGIERSTRDAIASFFRHRLST